MIYNFTTLQKIIDLYSIGDMGYFNYLKTCNSNVLIDFVLCLMNLTNINNIQKSLMNNENRIYLLRSIKNFIEDYRSKNSLHDLILIGETYNSCKSVDKTVTLIKKEQENIKKCQLDILQHVGNNYDINIISNLVHNLIVKVNDSKNELENCNVLKNALNSVIESDYFNSNNTVKNHAKQIIQEILCNVSDEFRTMIFNAFFITDCGRKY